MWAASQGHADVIRELVAHGVDVAAVSEVRREYENAGNEHVYFNRGGEPALVFAARGGYLEAVRALVEGGADVNQMNAAGISALAMAVQAEIPVGTGAYGQDDVTAGEVDPKYLAVANYLLENGADPDLTGYGHTPLHAAILRRNEATVRTLLEHGADPNAVVTAASPNRRMSVDIYFGANAVGASPFWLAARYNVAPIMRLLVEHGADPHFVHSIEGQGEITALMAAVGMGGNPGVFVAPKALEADAEMLEAVKVAVELGIDRTKTDARGRTAADAARGNDAVVEFLGQAGQ
jgi:ankyrin repeat protein